MNQKIGYPDYLNDTTAVDAEYKRYIVYDGDYYRTKFQFYEMYQMDVLERIRLAVDRERYAPLTRCPVLSLTCLFSPGALDGWQERPW